MAGRALRNLAAHAPETLGEALLNEFPWTAFLPKADRAEFIDDFTRTVVAAAELDTFAPFAQLIDEWRATAEIHAGRRSRRLRRMTGTSVGHPKVTE